MCMIDPQRESMYLKSIYHPCPTTFAKKVKKSCVSLTEYCATTSHGGITNTISADMSTRVLRTERAMIDFYHVCQDMSRLQLLYAVFRLCCRDNLAHITSHAMTALADRLYTSAHSLHTKIRCICRMPWWPCGTLKIFSRLTILEITRLPGMREIPNLGTSKSFYTTYASAKTPIEKYHF